MDETTVIRVLVVDDDPAFSQTVKNGLFQSRAPRYVVSVCSDHAGVMKAVEQTKPDVLLLDNDFHEKKIGISKLLPELVGRFSSLQDSVIICTGQRDQDSLNEIREALSWNAANFLDKPVSIGKLQSAINAVYERSHWE